jgi:hypothetical protein
VHDGGGLQQSQRQSTRETVQKIGCDVWPAPAAVTGS